LAVYFKGKSKQVVGRDWERGVGENVNSKEKWGGGGVWSNRVK